MPDKTCPHCRETKDTAEGFGYRNMMTARGREQAPQPWCRACRREAAKLSVIRKMGRLAAEGAAEAGTSSSAVTPDPDKAAAFVAAGKDLTDHVREHGTGFMPPPKEAPASELADVAAVRAKFKNKHVSAASVARHMKWELSRATAALAAMRGES